MSRKNWMQWLGVLVIMVVAMSLMLPATGISKDQIKQQDQLKEQLKDGSCQDEVLAAASEDKGDKIQDRLQTRDQLKDGSCQDELEAASEDKGDKIRDQLQTRDQLKDGSCK